VPSVNPRLERNSLAREYTTRSLAYKDTTSVDVGRKIVNRASRILYIKVWTRSLAYKDTTSLDVGREVINRASRKPVLRSFTTKIIRF